MDLDDSCWINLRLLLVEAFMYQVSKDSIGLLQCVYKIYEGIYGAHNEFVKLASQRRFAWY